MEQTNPEPDKSSAESTSAVPLLKWGVAAIALLLTVVFVIRGLTGAWNAAPPLSPTATTAPALSAQTPSPMTPLDAAVRQAEHIETERVALNRRHLREYKQLAEDALADLKAADEQIDAWNQSIEALLSNERGKLLTGDERLIADFRNITTADRPGNSRVQAIRDGVSDLLVPINGAIATDDGTYTPGASLVNQLQRDRLAAQAIVTSYREAQAQLDALFQRADGAGPMTLREALASLDARRAQTEAEARARHDEEEAQRNEALKPFMGQWVSHRQPFAFRIAGFHATIVLTDRPEAPVGQAAFTITSIDGRTFVGRELLTNGRSSDLTGELLDENLLYIRSKTRNTPYHRADGDPATAQATVVQTHVERMRAFFAEPDVITTYLPTMMLSAVSDESGSGWIASQLGKFYESESQFLPLFARSLAQNDPKKFGDAVMKWDNWVEGWKFTAAGKEVVALYDRMLADTRFQATPYDAFCFALESKAIREREFRSVEWLNERIGQLKSRGDTLTKSERQKLVKLNGWRAEINRRKFKAPPDPIRP